MQNEHDGHRKRLRERFISSGSFEGFAPHEVLELLLFYAIPRKNTNETAHALIKHFGSFSRVMEASYEDLAAVEGVGPNSAALLKAVFEGFKYYSRDKMTGGFSISSSKDAQEYCSKLFFGETEELSYLLCFDVKMKLANCSLVSRGNVNATAISVRNIVEIATRARATTVILAHNHPGGVAMPSPSDTITTKRIMRALSDIGITLADHIIYADGDVVSMSSGGMISAMRTELGIR